MRVHYALMDDTCSWEEFERLVFDEIESSAGEHDERSAAIDVVSRAGRLHTKISVLRSGPSLVSFFCKVIEVGKTERFERQDGGYGYVARVLCGDDTGEVVLTLWDDKAHAVGEIAEGEVLEVVGRIRRRGAVDVADLRKPDNDPGVSIRADGMKTLRPIPLSVRILAVADRGEYQKADGALLKYSRVIASDDRGEAEIIFWNNSSSKELRAGDRVSLSEVNEKPAKGAWRSYSAGENAEIAILSREGGEGCPSLSSKISDLSDGWSGSLSCTVEDAGSLREFKTRKGTWSTVRNILVSGEGGTATLVVWGEQAFQPFMVGETLNVFFARASEGRAGRSGSGGSNPGIIEFHAGYGSFVIPCGTGGRDVCLRGLIVRHRDYYSLDNDNGSWPLTFNGPAPNGCMAAEICGTLYDSGRIDVRECRELTYDPAGLRLELEEIRNSAGCR